MVLLDSYIIWKNRYPLKAAAAFFCKNIQPWQKWRNWKIYIPKAPRSLECENRGPLNAARGHKSVVIYTQWNRVCYSPFLIFCFSISKGSLRRAVLKYSADIIKYFGSVELLDSCIICKNRYPLKAAVAFFIIPHELSQAKRVCLLIFIFGLFCINLYVYRNSRITHFIYTEQGWGGGKAGGWGGGI